MLGNSLPNLKPTSLTITEVPKYELKQMKLTLSESTDVTAALLHTILFQRALSTIKPIDANCDFYKINYVKISDDAFDKKVNDMINSELHPKIQSDSFIDLTLSFYYTKKKSTFFGYFESIDKCLWEQWVIPIHIVKEPKGSSLVSLKDRAMSKDRKEKQQEIIEENLKLIVEHSNFSMDKNYMPSFQKDYGICYPFDLMNTKTPNTITGSIKSQIKRTFPPRFNSHTQL